MTTWRRIVWLILGLIAAVALAVIFDASFLAIPTPSITEIRAQGSTLTLSGKTLPHAVVVIMDEQGNEIDSSSTVPDGTFSFDNLVPPIGTQTLVVRTLNDGWRSSPPERVHFPLLTSITHWSSSTSSVSDADLPPPGIPPRDQIVSRPASPSSTVESISALAYLKTRMPSIGSRDTLSVNVQDQASHPLSGASVMAIIHDVNGDHSLTLTQTAPGWYNATFKVMAAVRPGAAVGIDITAHYHEFTSTAVAVFSPQ